MPKQEAPPLFSVNVIAGGEFFKAGKETPYKTADAVPETLKEFILDRDSQVENLDQERANLAAGEVYTVGSILTRSGAQQAVRLQQAIEFREWATDQAEASQQLAPEIEAVLQAEHDLSIGKALAQAEYHQEAVDRAYENATKEVDDRQQPMYNFPRAGNLSAAERVIPHLV